MFLYYVALLVKALYAVTFIGGMIVFIGIAVYLFGGVISSRKMWAGEHKSGTAVI